MPRLPARFRPSIKDNQTRTGLKVELIEAPGLWGGGVVRVVTDAATGGSGKDAENVKNGTLTEVFERLRRWVVARAE